jgi:hypothetical protein
MQKKLVIIVLLTLLFAEIFVVGLKVSPVFAPPTVDGVISSGEYDGGMAVQLVGRWNSSWTVDAYIAWTNEYVYVAVNEHVPTETGGSWIEFGIDPGSASTFLYAFAIFGTHTQSYVRYPKPNGGWSGLGAGNFSVVSGVATEFGVKYTDYGITFGDTIKLAIDRNNGSSGPLPRDWYGYAAFYPQGAVVYYGSPPAQPATWGDVHLGPSGPTTYELTVNSIPVSGLSYTVDVQSAVTGTPITLNSGSHTVTMPSLITVGADSYNFAHWEDSSTNPIRTINLQSNTVLTATYSNHTINGLISPGEYDGGMAVQLVGRPNWNPSWTVDAYIAWDTEYLYVAVNEHVPPTTGHKSWIEFAIDPSPSSSYLYAFIIFDDHVQACNRYTKPSGPWGLGVGTFLAVSGTATEFGVKYTDYGMTPGDAIKLAIDRNLGPAPPPPYGQAAFWPQNAIVYDGTPQAQPTTWGDVPPQPPHPCELTVNSIPVSGLSYTVDVQSAVTGTPITLDSGFHTITMPSLITSGGDSIKFSHWEVSSTNPVRTIDLQSNTVLTATYSNRTIDGVISAGEYDGALAVQLVGPYPAGAPFSPWTTDAYISWDTEYLYVAVNEPVPGTGKSSWIEFQFNTSAAYHSFVLFADGTPQHVLYPLPSGGWYWDVPAGFNYPYPWYAATNTATEFQVKYTDYGIAYGDLLKMSIDRGKDDFTYPPLGECSVWPNPCTFYPTADASTWGDVLLAPLLQPTVYITPPLTTKQFGEVGTTFEVTVMADDMTDLFGFDLNITWDNTLITFDHASYAANLDFIWGAGTYEVSKHDAGVEAGTGYYKFVALSLASGYTGSHALLTLGFVIQDPHTNWKKQTALHFQTDKLSDSGWQIITHTTTGATYEIFGSTPTLSLGLLTKTCRKINEEFEITVAISNCESVTGFDFEIHYDTALLDYVSGIVNLAYGTGTITPDEANGKVTGTTTGSASGSLTLVTIRFKATYSHMWKDELTIVPSWQNIWTGTIYIQSATLKYPSPQPDRTYTRGGLDNKINVGADVTYTWSPIQGDVDLDGDVDIIDLRDVSTFYDGTNANLNLTGASNLIDIFDLIVIAGNFGFSY